jgi:hypothetical protein
MCTTLECVLYSGESLIDRAVILRAEFHAVVHRIPTFRRYALLMAKPGQAYSMRRK